MLISLLSDPGRVYPAVSGRFDRQGFPSLVREHRLAPLLYYLLRREKAADHIPAPIRDVLKEGYYLQLSRATLAAAHLKEVLAVLRKAAIEVILLKGAHLAEAYYPRPALRPFDDVDLLLRPAEAEPARALLEERGYRLLEETAGARKFFLPGARKEGGFFLEIHTGLQTPRRRNPSFAIRISDFWNESCPFLYSGVPVRVLQPTRNLFYLAAHLSHHGFSRLIWLYDLHLVISKSAGEIKWDELVAEARRSRSAALVYYPLKFAGEILGSPVPGKVLAALAPPRCKKLAGAGWLKEARLEKGLPTAGIRGAMLRFLLNDSWPRAVKSYIFRK